MYCIIYDCTLVALRSNVFFFNFQIKTVFGFSVSVKNIVVRVIIYIKTQKLKI